MNIAVISDLHANLVSLKAVFKDLHKQKVDKIFCLGDFIDYGAKPEEVIQFIKNKQIPSVLGNHDAALFDKEVLKWFNDTAIESSKFSRKTISADSRAYLKNLPLHIAEENLYFVHAFPPDSFETYITESTLHDLKEAFNTFTQQICFVGHTHLLGIYELTKNKVKRVPLNRSAKLKKRSRYIINCGSTGQPRDEDNRAKYILYDTEKHQVKVRKVKYNIKKAQDNILKAGLNEENAEMLS